MALIKFLFPLISVQFRSCRIFATAVKHLSFVVHCHTESQLVVTEVMQSLVSRTRCNNVFKKLIHDRIFHQIRENVFVLTMLKSNAL